ncbi:hypothetical protein BH10PSE11_BH10PSE11_13660 [soil metagenome]
MLRSVSFVAAVVLSALPTAAFADRAPTPEERSRIEAALRSEGFTGWSEIEFDDGRWEIDDAVARDGTKYDLKLDNAMKVIKRERD